MNHDISETARYAPNSLLGHFCWRLITVWHSLKKVYIYTYTLNKCNAYQRIVRALIDHRRTEC